jgi:hypothetical protein
MVCSRIIVFFCRPQWAHFPEEEGLNGLDFGQGVLSAFSLDELPDLAVLELRSVGSGLAPRTKRSGLEAFPKRSWCHGVLRVDPQGWQVCLME